MFSKMVRNLGTECRINVKETVQKESVTVGNLVSHLSVTPRNDYLAVCPSLRDVPPHFHHRRSSHFQFKRWTGMRSLQSPIYVSFLLSLCVCSFPELLVKKGKVSPTDRLWGLSERLPDIQNMDIRLVTGSL